MTPQQQSALEGLVGRALAPGEITQLDILLPQRNDVAIAALLSVGRVKLHPRMITERGVRGTLSVIAAANLITLLREAADPANPPTWLPAVLGAAGVPQAAHYAYIDSMACAYTWLRQDAGIDVGSPAARGMLDLIALSDSTKFGASVTALKAIAEHPDPIEFNQVSDVLNVAEGR